MGIIAAGQITVVDLSDAPVLNAFITASRPTTQTYSKDSRNYNPSYASTPQVLTLNVTKSGSTTSIIDSIRGLHWFVVDGSVKTEITSKVNTSNEYISGTYDENLTTKLNIDTTKGYRRYEATGVWRDPSTDLDVQFTADINLLLTQNGATGPQGPQGDDGPQGPQGDKGETGNGIANTVVTYGLSMSDTTEPATWSSDRPALVKGMYLWTRTVIIYTNGESTTSYQISYIPKDGDATGEIDKTKQELLEKLETVRDDSLAAVEEAKQQLGTVRDDSLAAVEEAKQQVTTVANELSTAKQDFQNAVSAVDTKATNLQSDLAQAKQDLASQAQQLQEQAGAQSELTNRVSSVEKTANGTKTTVSELSKTVAQNGKDITSVTARTKVVEDDLAGTKTTLSQVQTTANSTSQKTATLETGLNGLSAKFENLQIGTKNILRNTSTIPLDSKTENYAKGTWEITSGGNGTAQVFDIDDAPRAEITNAVRIINNTSGGNKVICQRYVPVDFGKQYTVSCWARVSAQSGTDSVTLLMRCWTTSAANKELKTAISNTEWKRYTLTFTTESINNHSLQFGQSGGGVIEICGMQFEKGNIVSDYSKNDWDLSKKVAEYKQTADQNYASLQTTVQNLDGTVQHNKTVADQTAQGFTTRIESLETYKDGETTRANQYFESAKTETARQLTAERTAIAKDYVAKSSYTSDVTGIRNELSATTATANTIKTNLANYQASNDRAVANLQSNMQTANGNISSLKTKVEAVPGQITSAVSSVEGKIPKSVGGRNLALGTSADWSAGRTSFNGQENQTGIIYRVYNRGFKIGDKVNVRIVLKYSGIAVTEGQRAGVVIQFRGNVTDWGKGQLGGGRFWFDKSDGEIELKATTVVNENTLKNEYWEWRLRVDYVKSGKIQWKEAKAEVGDLPTPWSPAPEDTVEQISNLSSEIKQTADGMTLLATKTELNTAKNELQSGITTATNKANSAQSTANSNAQTISTHTTQISALNTGLQAKVSQTDFNTLSGRVTTAENNITAKANELSSKITSVEGKIPTSIGSTNLLLYSADPWKAPSDYYQFNGVTKTDNTLNGSVVYKTNTAWNSLRSNWGKHLIDRKNVKVGDEFTYSIYAKTDQSSIRTRLYIRFSGQSSAEGLSSEITLTNEWKKLSVTFKVTQKMVASQTKLSWVGFEQTSNSENGKFVYYACNKLERGNIATDYSPAPEDAISQISSLSSELSQTKDGITLLATKTELNSAKNDLQSGINTATNKANAAQNAANNAQNKANNNAQTISTHTTQISALNTGLQAKVSQSDFNTLSGRVTTAENNITAKANELSSKITSVEGKIPTDIGTVNLVKGTGSAFVMGYGITNTTWNETKKQSILDFSTPGINLANSSEILPQGNKFCDFKPIKGTTYTQSIMIDTDATFNPNGRMEFTWFANRQHNSQKGYIKKVGAQSYQVWSTYTWNLDNTALRAFDMFYLDNVLLFRTSGTYLAFYKPKLTIGNLPSDWSPSPEDYDDALTRVSSEIKQTADGMTLLATKTELNTAKSDLQSGINTATNKANAAQNTANSAQNKANSNAQTISTHTNQISALNTGLSAKVSQTDFNTLSGRVTTAENNITAKANELSSKITKVEGKIPTSSGGRNLAQGTSKDWSNPFTGFSGNQNTCPYLYKVLTDGLVVGDTFKTRIVLKYTDIRPASGKTAEIWLQGAGNVTEWNSGTYPSGGGGVVRSISGSGQIVFELTDKINADHLKNSYWDLAFRTDWIASGSLQWKLAKAERGMFFTDWTPAPEDTISQINSVSSEFKQTTDSIKASVTSLDKSTVKSSSLTINSDGIVMKAGKSTTDVANAIGSYFSVNQNAINLFSDKIKVKGNMIVSGSISSDKIASNGITANVIKGGTLQSTNGSTNFELNTGKLFYNNNNTGVFRVQNGASTMGLKFSNTSLTVNGTSRILSRAILGGDRRESTLDDGKWNKGGFSGLVIETIKGVEPATNEHADALRAISDTIYFTHTYSADEPTGVSAHGWKMETYAPNSSYSGNIVLKPYGINYRQSDIVVGDVRLDNGDGSGYWMRATINTLKACFGHILNGGTSSQALNAIRSELNKISGT